MNLSSINWPSVFAAVIIVIALHLVLKNLV